MRQISMDPDGFDGRWGPSQERKECRRQWERLLHLSRFLDERERVLLEAVIDQGGRVSRLARLTRRNPVSLRRHIRDILRRLTGHELDVLLKYPDVFSGFEQACLREHLVRKRPLGRVAKALGTSVYEVRKALATVRVKTERLSRTDVRG